MHTKGFYADRTSGGDLGHCTINSALAPGAENGQKPNPIGHLPDQLKAMGDNTGFIS